MQQDILNVLVRFRQYAVGIVGDIQEMFLQIGLDPKDRPYHRFLWRGLNKQNQPTVFEFQRLVFGNRASPFLAQKVLDHIASNAKEEYQNAVDTIRNAMIVDDITDSQETVNDAIELRRQLTSIFAASGFHIRKWISGVNQTLVELSSRFWVMKGREAVREFQKGCMTCRRRDAKPARQIMAPLPKVRLDLRQPLRAFTTVGIDFGGPYYTKQGRGKSQAKRYLCVFSCLYSRAVHLEMTSSLDTSDDIFFLCPSIVCPARTANRPG